MHGNTYKLTNRLLYKRLAFLLFYRAGEKICGFAAMPSMMCRPRHVWDWACGRSVDSNKKAGQIAMILAGLCLVFMRSL